MVVVYGLATLFLTWLVLVLVQAWNWYQLNQRTTGAQNRGLPLRARAPASTGLPGTRAKAGGRPRWLAVLLLNQAGGAEGLVRRLAWGRNRDLNVHPVLVDGGSTDDTAFILERLAGRFNLGFGRLEDLGGWETLEKRCYLDLRHLSSREVAKIKLL